MQTRIVLQPMISILSHGITTFSSRPRMPKHLRRPGTIIAYDRNYVTNRLLEDEGVEVLKIPSGELSRGRGGPRCMSMPLVRE